MNKFCRALFTIVVNAVLLVPMIESFEGLTKLDRRICFGSDSFETFP